MRSMYVVDTDSITDNIPLCNIHLCCKGGRKKCCSLTPYGEGETNIRGRNECSLLKNICSLGEQIFFNNCNKFILVLMDLATRYPEVVPLGPINANTFCLSFCLSVCLSVHLPASLPVCPSVCLLVSLFICLSIHLSIPICQTKW